MKSETEKSASRRKLVYATVVVIVILVSTMALFNSYLHPDSQAKAAIIDQLSSSKLSTISRHQNQTFIAEAQDLLQTRFAEVDYYSDNATVDNYRILPSLGYKLIIWRAHTALDLNSKYIAISTSERYGSKSYDQYSNDQLTLCNITDDPRLYFAITPKFIEECMDGRFKDTVIILMSCNGLKSGYGKTAEALVQKGAKILVSWNDWIDSSDNDDAITLFLQRLIVQNSTIGEAVAQAPKYDSSLYGPNGTKLDYYPHNEVAGYRIPDYRENNMTTSAGLALSPINRKTKAASTGNQKFKQ
ncbi:MAG: hypothetical protein WBV70_05970 [Candidatus Bathyarchaeia archaeon]